MKLRSVSGGIIAVLLVFATSGASAQQNLETAITQPYVVALLQTLEEWNQKKLKLKKADFEASFTKRAKRLEALQARAQDDLEKYIPVKKMRERWKELPDVLQSDIPLTVGAQMMLTAALYDKLDSIKTKESPTREDLIKLLGSSLYLTLASSQLEAKGKDKKAIDTTSLQRGQLWFFSLGWPFCCAE